MNIVFPVKIGFSSRKNELQRQKYCMRKILSSLFLSCFLTGCIITQHKELHYIINKNTENYKNHEQIRFNNIAAILKSYSNLVNSKNIKNLENLKKDTKQFVDNLEKNNISDNYPIKPSKKEVYLIKIFLEDIIDYMKKNKINGIKMKNNINQILKIYIIDISRG